MSKLTTQQKVAATNATALLKAYAESLDMNLVHKEDFTQQEVINRMEMIRDKASEYLADAYLADDKANRPENFDSEQA